MADAKKPRAKEVYGENKRNRVARYKASRQKMETYIEETQFQRFFKPAIEKTDMSVYTFFKTGVEEKIIRDGLLPEGKDFSSEDDTEK